MIRWLIFITIIASLYFGGQWLLDHPGEVNVNWLGLEITLHVAMLGFVLLVFTIIIGYFSVLLWRAATWQGRRKARKQHRNFKRGLEHLTRGVTALAMGDEDIAEESLKKARLAMPDEPLPQLLTAQMLQRQGKQADAQAQFRALMHHPSTVGLATRKLIEQHLIRQEWREAKRLTEEARSESPRDAWLTQTMIDLSARNGDATQMLALTEGWQFQSPLTKEERHRYAALAHYIAATQTDNERKKEQSLRHAVGYAPSFLPAIIDYARLLIAQKSNSRARKRLLEAWNAKPSPLLIAPIIESIGNVEGRSQIRLLKPFLRGNMTAAHHALAARQAMLINDPARARTELEQAIRLEETKESILLIAELESKLRNNQAANSWTSRAVDAPLGPTWVCHDCGKLHDTWAAHCSACGHFDSLRYERPEERITSVELTTA